MNNKGFAVSSILYTILICFLMFLGAAMAMFSASNGLVVAANDDIINGTRLKASRIVGTIGTGDAAKKDVMCAETKEEIISSSGKMFEYFKWSITETAPSSMLIKINSRYGSKFWPKDFSSTITKKYDYNNDGADETVYCSISAANLCVNKISHQDVVIYNNYKFDDDENVVHYSEEIIFIDVIAGITSSVTFKNPCN